MIKGKSSKYVKIIVTYKTYIFIESPDIKDINSIDEELLKNTEKELLYHAGYVSSMDAPDEYLFDSIFHIKLCNVFKLNYSDEATDAYDVEDVHFEIIKGKVALIIDWKGRINKNEENLDYEIQLFGKEKAEREILRMAQNTQRQEKDWKKRDALMKKEITDPKSPFYDNVSNVTVWTDAIDLEY